MLGKQIKDVDAQLRKIFKEDHHNRQMKILQSHPGIGPITARQYRSEVFSPERFEKSTQLTRYPKDSILLDIILL
jgi:transposase